MRSIVGLSASPDGTQLSFRAAEGAAELWTINFLTDAEPDP